MSFHHGDSERGAQMSGNELVVYENSRYTKITVDVELRDRLLLELLGDDVLDGPEQSMACDLYNAICARIDRRAAA